MENSPIAITGATGFLGRRLVRELLRRGRIVRGLHRAGSPVQAIAGPGVQLREARILDAGQMAWALSGCRAVIHCAAATDATREDINRALNVDAVSVLVRACRDAGVRRLVFLSTTCVTRPLRDSYSSTKLEGELIAAASGLDWTIFRPTMIYGRGSKEFETFLRALRWLPVTPLFGGGGKLIQPVAVWEAARAIALSLERPAALGRKYDLAGPHPIAMKDFARETARALGVRARFAPVPVGPAFHLTKVLGSVWEHPPINTDQVLAFAQDTVVDIEPARRDLDFDPPAYPEGLRRALSGE
ncbi:MAG: 2-alkyl-3-oxoalkanoate reductase [Myxococcota bacterium]|nr:2-alkyl-3-oxoalkanoate reductase [Myxococcota bacterium]